MKYETICDWCGKQINKYCITKHKFCSRECMNKFRSKDNPNYLEFCDYTNIRKTFYEKNCELNKKRMTPEVRKKIRESRLNKGKNKTYTKTFGVHTHRLVAEKILGRPLKPGEVVHHIDGNRRNNAEWNIRVIKNSSEHARLHMLERIFWNKGGGNDEV